MSDKPLYQSPEQTRRALALDALRGLAILTMFLSGRVPFGVLPRWMYHAQNPPPAHQFVPTLPGITWVDLVFPFFLFSMGAAIPLSLSRKIEKGEPAWKIIAHAIGRGFLLVGFAIFDMHMRPHVLDSPPTTVSYLLGLLGFFLLFPVLGRFPFKMSKYASYGLKAAGLAGMVVFLYLAQYPDGSGFRPTRSDIIILVLANVAMTASIIWFFTRSNSMLRLGLLVFVLAARLVYPEVSWGGWLWKNSPVPWFGMLYFQQYLFIVIPGTVIGDFILEWMKSKDTAASSTEAPQTWSKTKLVSITLLMFTFVIVQLTGLLSRHVLETLLISILLSAAGFYLLRMPNTGLEKLMSKIYPWGVYFLLAGLVLEPYEGGIQKGNPTMSYYFVTSGLAVFMLIAFTIIIQVFRKQKYLQLLIDNGQNPMVAYAGITNLLPPLLALTAIGPLINQLMPTPWLGALRAVIETAALGVLVSLFTRLKIYLRT